ncbi:hypothetical protein Acr_10g0003650 [Actinidia rufa]|uniref:Uncharacterized protein n=1 Tax=Actinidia rufa TaxID=165716 RepID=A0A7J0F8E2_9ERIC|nr:hypothetical protein Acr_10g0003650 [Actinidia rufa]
MGLRQVYAVPLTVHEIFVNMTENGCLFTVLDLLSLGNLSLYREQLLSKFCC